MLSQRRTTSAIALDELKRRNDLESLRKYLILEGCFPASKDPETSPITLEELKKLVRIWKLNERRNFWKTHSERDEIVSALIQHADQNMNFSPTKKVNLPSTKTVIGGSVNGDQIQPQQSPHSVTALKPVPPADSKPSAVVSVPNIRNFCGLKYFNREVSTKELTTSGRFFQFPETKDRVDNVVDQWRHEDFDMKDDLLTAMNNASSANGNNPSGGSFAIGTGPSSFNVNSTPNSSIRNATVSGIKSKVKIVKQRNLAMHLMNFSSHIDLKKTQFNMKNVQTFISVAESDDPKTVSKCMIALSNIAAEPLVRNILLEMNTMHKITNMLQYLRGKAAHWAAGLLFYYFSCDKESEDRIYNACSVFLQLNGSSKDSQVRAVTLYTLNNLMPCIDRQRIAELIMRILQSQFEPNIVFHDKSLSSTYLTIMQNMTWFTNAHSTLLSLNILELLEKFARFAINQKNNEMALAVAKILQSFLQLPDSASAIVGIEFISILCILFESDYEPALIQALKACVVLSSLPNLRRLVQTTELTKTISNTIINRSNEGAAGVTNALGKEAAKYFCNITFPFHSSSPSKENLLRPSSSSHPHHHSHHKGNPNDDGTNVLTAETIEKIHIATMERLLEENIHEAVFVILKSSNPSLHSKAIAIRALQNIVSYPSNGYKLSKQCVEPMMSFLTDCSSPLFSSSSSIIVPASSPSSNSSSSAVSSESHGLGAAYVIYNLATIPLCRNELVEKKVHLKILEFMTKVKESSLKSAFLQILVQLSGSNICIVELLKMNLIHKLETQIQFVSKSNANKSPKKKKDDEEQENLDILNAEGKNKEKESENSNGVWRDISLMLLAVVAYTSHDLTEDNQIAIISILKQICSFPGINNDIIENCANVLKFISSRYAAYNELDPVIRSILTLSDSENDETIDNDISTILYNMTCYDVKNLDFMLKDTYYINIMIRIMRNGKVTVQENIAYAIRTLCSVEKCTELLLKHDIISDLIVIALLRTSSEEIKIVCSQAFYNMVCSSKCRLELLKGDLWWALTRLGRTDSIAVRNMCIRALNDLSSPLDSSFFSSAKLAPDQIKHATLHKSCILALRAHHVLSFMKDLTLASPASSLLQCLQIVHNFLKQFAQFHDSSSHTSAIPLPSSSASNPYAVHEVVAAIRIASDAINRSSDIQCIRIATILLLKCSQLHFNNINSSNTFSAASASSSATTIENNPNNNMIDNEFINIDISEVLRLSINNWKGNNECRANISRLLYELGKRKFFSKLVPLNEMNEILVAVYNPANTKENTIEMLENIIGFLLQFILSENVKPIEIIQLTIWPLLLRDSLSTNSSLPAVNNPLFFLKPAAGGGGNSGPLAVGLGGLTGLSGGLSPAPPAVGMGSPSTSLPKGRISLYQRESSMANTESFEPLRGVIPTPFRVQGMALILFSYCIESMLSLLQKHYQKNDGKLSINESGTGGGTSSDNAALSTDDVSFAPAPMEREESVLSATGSATVKKRKASSLKDNSDVVNSLLTIHFPSLLQGIIKTDFIDYIYTRNNLLHILHIITQYNTPVIEAIFIPDTFQLVLRLLNNSIGSSRYDRIQEYCSCFLRNIAINHNYLLSFIQTPHFQVVNELISELADLAITNLSLAMDLSIFFYFLSDYLQTPSLTAINNKDEAKMLSPKFALDMINKLLSHQVLANSNPITTLAVTTTATTTTNTSTTSSSSSATATILSSEENYKVYLNTYYEMININKYTISIILNKYTFHNGVDPLFVQNMYSYLQTNSLVVIPNLMKDVSYKKLSEIKNCLYSEYLHIKEMTIAELLLFYEDNPSYFKPIILNNFQENDHIILKLTNSKSVVYEKLETIESISIIVFQKMIIPFEPTTESQYDLHNNMISEEVDEDDEKSISNHQHEQQERENNYEKSKQEAGLLVQEATPQIREENEDDTDDETSPSHSNTGSRVTTATKHSKTVNGAPDIGEGAVLEKATEEDTSNLKSSECRRVQNVKDSALSLEEKNDSATGRNSLLNEKLDIVTSLKNLSISPKKNTEKDPDSNSGEEYSLGSFEK
jgi:hypothetical protein